MYQYNYYRKNDLPTPDNLPPPKHKKKKFDFKSLKKNTFSSLNDVENFLCGFNSFCKYLKFYNLFKK